MFERFSSHLPAILNAQEKVSLVFNVDSVDNVCQKLMAKGADLKLSRLTMLIGACASFTSVTQMEV